MIYGLTVFAARFPVNRLSFLTLAYRLPSDFSSVLKWLGMKRERAAHWTTGLFPRSFLDYPKVSDTSRKNSLAHPEKPGERDQD
jgi:hypothetical protein